jgi:hypothetical protein
MSVSASRNTYLIFLQSEIVSEDRISNEKLFDLYKISIDTDRFELELGWKLVQFFTVLNSGLLSLGFTLLGSSQLSPKYYVAPIFIIGIVISWIAVASRRRYHEHSLRASYKKTLIEKELKLYRPLDGYDYNNHNLAVSTSSKKDPEKDILIDPEGYIKKNTLKPWTVPFNQVIIFCIFIALYIVGLIIILIPFVLWHVNMHQMFP